MQNKNFDFFFNNMESLYDQYGHKFLAIKDENIIGSYSSFKEALDETLKQTELGTFLIQECFDNKEKLINHFQGNVVPSSL